MIGRPRPFGRTIPPLSSRMSLDLQRYEPSTGNSTCDPTDLSDDHDGEVIEHAFAELSIVRPVLVQPFHGSSHFCEQKSDHVTWASETLTCILTSLKCFIEFGGSFFEVLYPSLFLERLLGKCEQCFLTDLNCFLSVRGVRTRGMLDELHTSRFSSSLRSTPWFCIWTCKPRRCDWMNEISSPTAYKTGQNKGRIAVVN